MSLSRVLIKGFLRAAFRAYFRGIHVRGIESVPVHGPVLFVANHPNSLLDPAVLIHVLPRPIHFGAKHTLFSTPLRPILKALGAIPIVRAEDDRRAMRRNMQAIDAYARLLGQGRATAIFPEGLSQDNPQLAPLKGGASRIVLNAEAAADFKLGVRIVPVGLQFEPRRKFRGDAYVRFGEPVRVEDLAGLYREKRAASFKALTARMARALGELSLHVESIERFSFVERLTDIYLQRAWKTGLRGVTGKGLRGELLYRVAACLNHFSDADPRIVRRVEHSLKRYERLREAAGVDSRLIEEPSFLISGILAHVQALCELLVGAPAAAFGFITGGGPYYLTRLLSARIAVHRRHPASSSTFHVLIGAVVFPFIWALELSVVWWASSLETTAFFAGLLVPAGLFSWFYVRRFRKLAVHLGGRLASRMKLDAVVRVRDARRELLDLMDQTRERYLREVFGPPTGIYTPSSASRNP